MKIYCAGIGGIGLSAYASLQKVLGHSVSGSDRSESMVTDDLERQGIMVFFQQDGFHVPRDADLFVYSEAIPNDAPERVRAREYKIRQMSYFQALGELSRGYTTVIAVCGTHGKSTTTAMAAKVLVDLGKNPTVIVGTRVPQLDGKNWRQGGKDLLLLEACEYRGSFLNIHPHVVLLTNVDWDHVDAFPSREEYQEVFVKFLQQLPANGVVVTHGQDAGCMAPVRQAGLQHRMIDADGVSSLDLLPLSVPGRHMVDNASLVFALCTQYFSADRGRTSDYLRDFRGTWRRMEERGHTKDGAVVIDDYAHHPKEIMATINAMREKYPTRRLICVFQPHMFDRTKHFYQEFTKAFLGVYVLLTDVYEARREQSNDVVSLDQFAKDIKKESGEPCRYVGNLEEAEKVLRVMLRPNDLVVCMGAGSITDLATRMIADACITPE